MAPLRRFGRGASQPYESEISHGGRTYQFSVVPFRDYVNLYGGDITGRKRAEDEVRRLAYFDPLTGIANRVTFLNSVEEAVAWFRRRNESFAVHFIDLDHFKDVNDGLGHGVGDTLLQLVAARLRANVRTEDSLARLGGDEFGIVQTGVQDSAEAETFAQKLISILGDPFDLGGADMRIGASLGIAMGDRKDMTASGLLEEADVALYEAKGSGRGQFALHSGDLSSRVRHVMETVQDLRRAIERREFVLYYQPQIRLESGAAVGFEALIRWRHPERGLVAPGEFIEIAETHGLIPKSDDG